MNPIRLQFDWVRRYPSLFGFGLTVRMEVNGLSVNFMFHNLYVVMAVISDLSRPTDCIRQTFDCAVCQSSLVLDGFAPTNYITFVTVHVLVVCR